MSDATFATPDRTKFCRLDQLGLKVTGQLLEPDLAVLACRVVEPDEVPSLRGAGGGARHRAAGTGARDVRVATNDAAGTVRRYKCTGCAHVWRQGTSRAGLRWALQGLVCQHLTVARVAEGLAVAWDTTNDAVLAEASGC